MTITVRRSGPQDREAILALMAASRGDGLSAEERAERGFVQGRMDEDVLTRFQQGTGVFVAEDGVLAGFAMTSEPGAVTSGPPRLAVDAVGEGRGRLFLYGPAAVDRDYQGRGVLTKLLAALSRALRDRFDLGVAFVEAANAKSLAVHRHYGMTEAATFVFDDRDYFVFTFSPDEFADRN
ncbi:GNAT family N-acetyltransferase [Rhodococcus hoagii]|nr:GNAT family N-acetyltransferase [Prescottella equi]NKR61831.1 GNAT family N-acetyltransferase [Prescottella equi]NKR71046.1 GNAT family N-acetyltransferase [Prescottella equi]